MNILDQTFKDQDFSNAHFKRGEYDNCTFINCNFEKADIGNTTFLECRFEECNMANAIVANTAFKEVTFDKCKLMGIDFSSCNPFMLDLDLRMCDLSLASFQEMELKNQIFYHCTLKETDFTLAKMPGVSFVGCELDRAVFDRCDLQNANFTTSDHITIDPERNQLKGARFDLQSLPGLLTKHNIIVK